MSPITRHRRPRHTDVRGFSLLEILLVVAVSAAIVGSAVPALTGTLREMRVGMATREVERELQNARLRAVSSNRPIRVRFNCPAAGEYRVVELLGTPTVPAPDDGDSQAAVRCGDLTRYPYPDAERGIFDMPNWDGPVQRLPIGVVFGATTTIEFWPDGTAHAPNGMAGMWPQIATDSPVRLEVRRQTTSSAPTTPQQKIIEVNGLGRIQIQH